MGTEPHDWEWQSGDGPSTEIGYLNVNSQQCCGHRGVPGTDHLQHAYKVECTRCGSSTVPMGAISLKGGAQSVKGELPASGSGRCRSSW